MVSMVMYTDHPSSTIHLPPKSEDVCKGRNLWIANNSDNSGLIRIISPIKLLLISLIMLLLISLIRQISLLSNWN